MMKLLKWELRKIWQPGILVALLLLGVVYYWMFPQFYIEHFCNGPNEEAEFILASGWVEKYGPTMETAERAELDGQLAEEIRSFDRSISAIPEAAAAGLTDYDTFCSFYNDYLNNALDNDGKADMDIESLLHWIYGGTNWYLIQELRSTMETYDSRPEYDVLNIEHRRTEGHPSEMIQRDMEIASSDMAYSLLPMSVKESTRQYGMDLAVWCVLSVVILLSPTLVRDRLRKIQPMQWSARAGRKILNTQIGAALLSALVITAVNLTAYAVPFLMKGPLRFADCGLDGLWAWGTPWFDWTYGTYLLVLAAMILLLSLGAAGLTVFLSQYSGNYVSMLLKALPLFIVVGAILGSWLLDNPFHFRCWWGNGPWAPRGAEPMILFPLMFLGLGLCAWSCRRQTKRELL